MSFATSCTSNLETLDLRDNQIETLSAQWFLQMPRLKQIALSRNKLLTFEIWLITLDSAIDYSSNPVNSLSNDEKIDLSNADSLIEVSRVDFGKNFMSHVRFDDGIFPMSNRCHEIQSSTNPRSQILKRWILESDRSNPGLFSWICSCRQFFLQRYALENSNRSIAGLDRTCTDRCQNRWPFNQNPNETIISNNPTYPYCFSVS